MVRGFALVFFFSMMELCVLDHNLYFAAECGKTANITIPCNMSCDLSIPITNVTLIRDNVQVWTTDKPSCLQDDKYCFQIAENRNQTLIVRSPSLKDEGAYDLNINQSCPNCLPYFRINFYVNGVCEPELSKSEDGLTCSVKATSTYKPEITWMPNGEQKGMKQHSKNNGTKFVEFQSSIKLTEETKKVQSCCIVSYENNGKQYKQKCINPQDMPGAESFQEVSGNDKRNSIIPVVCVLVVIGFGVACYIAYYRFRRHLKGGCSNSNLLGSEENTESSVKLQSSQDPV